MKLQISLIKIGACSEAVEWVSTRNLSQAWEECERADWMLWICGIMAGKSGWPTRPQVVLAVCLCAERALKHVPAGEDRPRLAIEAARAWAANPTNAAAYAAYDAYENATAAAARGAYDDTYGLYASEASTAAARAAYAASDIFATSMVAVAAARAAYATGNATENAKAELKAMAEILRSELKIPESL